MLPKQSGEIQLVLQRVLHQNMDVEAVFAAVGEAVTGRSQALVQAVFGNGDLPPEQEPIQLPEEAWGESALSELHRFHCEAEGSKLWRQDAAAEAMALYEPEELPPNVVMEQCILGFAYAAPVQGVVSSGFGWRTHPTGGGDRFHYGVDLAAEAGSQVTAFADGIVTLAGESTSYGKYCMVSHENGYQTLYAHCRTLTVSSGDSVTLGDQLGEVGETGQTTGPHLHFELQKDGTYYNPIYYAG